MPHVLVDVQPFLTKASMHLSQLFEPSFENEDAKQKAGGLLVSVRVAGGLPADISGRRSSSGSSASLLSPICSQGHEESFQTNESMYFNRRFVRLSADAESGAAEAGVRFSSTAPLNLTGYTSPSSCGSMPNSVAASLDNSTASDLSATLGSDDNIPSLHNIPHELHSPTIQHMSASSPPGPPLKQLPPSLSRLPPAAAPPPLPNALSAGLVCSASATHPPSDATSAPGDTSPAVPDGDEDGPFLPRPFHPLDVQLARMLAAVAQAVSASPSQLLQVLLAFAPDDHQDLVNALLESGCSAVHLLACHLHNLRTMAEEALDTTSNATNPKTSATGNGSMKTLTDANGGNGTTCLAAKAAASGAAAGASAAATATAESTSENDSEARAAQEALLRASINDQYHRVLHRLLHTALDMLEMQPRQPMAGAPPPPPPPPPRVSAARQRSEPVTAAMAAASIRSRSPVGSNVTPVRISSAGGGNGNGFGIGVLPMLPSVGVPGMSGMPQTQQAPSLGGFVSPFAKAAAAGSPSLGGLEIGAGALPPGQVVSEPPGSGSSQAAVGEVVQAVLQQYGPDGAAGVLQALAAHGMTGCVPVGAAAQLAAAAGQAAAVGMMGGNGGGGGFQACTRSLSLPSGPPAAATAAGVGLGSSRGILGAVPATNRSVTRTTVTAAAPFGGLQGPMRGLQHQSPSAAAALRSQSVPQLPANILAARAGARLAGVAAHPGSFNAALLEQQQRQLSALLLHQQAHQQAAAQAHAAVAAQQQQQQQERELLELLAAAAAASGGGHGNHEAAAMIPDVATAAAAMAQAQGAQPDLFSPQAPAPWAQGLPAFGGAGSVMDADMAALWRSAGLPGQVGGAGLSLAGAGLGPGVGGMPLVAAMQQQATSPYMAVAGGALHHSAAVQAAAAHGGLVGAHGSLALPHLAAAAAAAGASMAGGWPL